MYKRISFIIVLVLLGFIIACEEDPLITGDEVSYTADIRPLIDRTCTGSGCHGGGSIVFELITYNQVKLKASEIRRAVWTSRTMPPDGSLTEEERKKFRDWVDAGEIGRAACRERV